MNYKIDFSSSAGKFFERLDNPDALRIIEKLKIMSENPLGILSILKGIIIN